MVAAAMITRRRRRRLMAASDGSDPMKKRGRLLRKVPLEASSSSSSSSIGHPPPPQKREKKDPSNATAGVRKPRSGSGRKPRSRSHSLFAFNQEASSSFPGDLDVFLDQPTDIKETGGMGDLDDKIEVKIFQRRDKKREDNTRHFESRPGEKLWRDSEAVEKILGGDAGTFAYQRTKELEYPWDKPNRQSGDDYYQGKDRSQFSQGHTSEDRHFANNAWKENAIFKDKDGSYRDWNHRDSSRERNHDKAKCTYESRNNHSKSRCANAGKRSLNDISGVDVHRAALQRDNATSHAFEQESSGDQPQSESMSVEFSQGSSQRSKSIASMNKSAGYENVIGGDGRSAPKLKLKVNGITQSRRSQNENGNSIRPHVKKQLSPSSEPNKRRQRLILQEDSDEGENAPDIPLPSKAKGKLHSTEEDGFLAYLADDRSYRGGSSCGSNQNLQGIRKSSRVPKRRVFDGDDDIELEPKKRRRKKVEADSDEDIYRMEEDDMEQDLFDEEIVDAVNEEKPKGRRRRKSLEAEISVGDLGKVTPSSVKPGDGSPETRTGVLLTARQRALQCSKGPGDGASSLIEFPEGLTLPIPKKPKDSLTAAERQLKKEEAAVKRRQQVEKAAKEQQAFAMQKVLNQDSQRKKREGKLQKQREELEQEKKAAAMAPPTNSIRWVMGTNGTIVSFSQDLEMPNIFSGPLSYPREREQCAGPSCNNSYKYRDSKTRLPLCSLQCYKAVQKLSEAALAH